MFQAYGWKLPEMKHPTGISNTEMKRCLPAVQVSAMFRPSVKEALSVSGIVYYVKSIGLCLKAEKSGNKLL